MKMSLPRYDRYKDSGVEWLGEIPDHWELATGRTCFSQQEIKNKGNSEKTVLSLSYGRIVIKPKEKLYGLVPESFETYQIVDKGNIIIRSTDLQNDKTSLRIGLVKNKGIITSAYLCLATKNKISAKFAYYLLHAYDLQKIYYGMGSGLRQNLSFTDFKYLSIPLPEIAEQKRIAEFLDRKCGEIDEAIAKKQRLIELLEEQKTILINQAVTKGLNPDAPMKDSGIEWLGAIPQHWGMRKLGYTGSFQNGISEGADYFGSGNPFVNYTDVYKHIELPIQVVGLAKSTEIDRQKYSVEKGDVFFTRTSETIEEIGFSSTCFKTIKDAIFSGFLIRFRPQKEMLFEGFSKYYFRAQIHRFFFVKEMNLVIRASLSQELLRRLPVLMPPQQEQKEIAIFLDQQCEFINLAKYKIQKQIKNLTELKQILIAEAVTGKIKV